MKALQFTIPVSPGRSVILQEDIIPNFYPYLHRHQEAQLIWVIKGAGTLIVENSFHEFQPEDIFYLAPNQSHVFVNNETGADETNIHSVSVFFDPDGQLAHLFELPEMTQLKRFINSYSCGFKVGRDNSGEISKKIKELQDTEDFKQLFCFLSLIQLLSEFTSTHIPLTSIRNNKISEGEGLRMSLIYQYIMQHFDRDMTLDDVASVANLTPQAFCRYFKKHSGITFIAFLNGIRVHEACKSLSRGQFDSISSVAYSCGFNSIPNFNRVFKTVTGASPKTFLSRLRSQLPEK